MTTMAQPAHNRYIPEFDGLRGIAAIIVVLGHVAPAGSLLKEARLPGMSVSFFFALSGFLITGILLSMRKRVEQEHSSSGSELRNFYARRALRIFPPFYAFLLFFWFVGNPYVQQTFWWHACYLTNFYPLFGGTVS